MGSPSCSSRSMPSRSTAATSAVSAGESVALRLEQLLAGADSVLRITPLLEATTAVHEALVADGWEGTVAKRATGRYRCGRRSPDWLKLKSPSATARDRARVELTLRRRAVREDGRERGPAAAVR